MLIKNCKIKEVEEALKRTNKKFNNNVIFNRNPEYYGKYIRCTLKVKNSRGKGAKLGYSGRRTISACWHVHGELFESLLNINPEAVIISAGHKIDIYGGNWQDWNIGSVIGPMNYSEACECN